jgi:hypothetical protein
MTLINKSVVSPYPAQSTSHGSGVKFAVPETNPKLTNGKAAPTFSDAKKGNASISNGPFHGGTGPKGVACVEHKLMASTYGLGFHSLKHRA